MAGNQLPALRHVLPLTTVTLERKLPGPGTVTVRVREKVQPPDVVAEVQPPAKHYFLDLAAGVPRVVVASDGTSSLAIETTGALVQGAWGNGRRGWGVMRVIGKGPSDRLHTTQLDVELRGAGLLAGVCDNAAPLHQGPELAGGG